MTFDVALTTTQAWIFLPVVLPIALWAIYTDLKDMKILNITVLALLAGFVVLGPFALSLEEYAWRFAHFGIVLVIGFFASALLGIGAGDAKFAAAMAPFVAASDAGLVAMLVAFSALIGLILHRMARSVPAIVGATPEWVSWQQDKVFPYGVGLSSGLLIYFFIGIS